ncbi:hypothetical protein [Streptomyces lunaelactis]|nr:hypothetical protein [Streptomyces lunaelactis]
MTGLFVTIDGPGGVGKSTADRYIHLEPVRTGALRARAGMRVLL